MSRAPQPADSSLILLTRNGGERFRACIAALRRCEGVDELEWIVVDSSSNDGTERIGAALPGVRFHSLDPREFGHGRTRNLAARLATRDVLIFLVQDAVPQGGDFLLRLLAPLAETRVAGAFARQIPAATTNAAEAHFLSSVYPAERRVREDPGGRELRFEEYFFSNVAAAIRRSAWKQEPFADDIVMSEDQEWARRILRAGWQLVYESMAVVEHAHDYRLGQLLRRNFDSAASLRDLGGGTFAELAAGELAYLGRGIAALTRQGRAHALPHFALWEATRALGALLGRSARWLPRGLVMRLTHYPDSWRRRWPQREHV